MSIHDYISFHSNEEYERSIFQFVQMAGEMTIRDAKQRIDQLIDRTFSKKRFLTYKYNSRNRGGNAMCLIPASVFKKGGNGYLPIP